MVDYKEVKKVKGLNKNVADNLRQRICCVVR